jgi:hypothetical protein
MRLRIAISIGMLITLTTLMIIIGCSSNHEFVTPSGGGNATISNNYFPVTEGLTTVFEVKEGTKAPYTYTLVVDDSVLLGSQIAHKWIGVTSWGSTDTSFIVRNQNSVLIYESVRSIPEQILRTPLVVGSTWNRYQQTDDATITDTTDIVVPITGDQADSAITDDVTNDIAYPKVIPTEGLNVYSIVAFEDLALSSKEHYSNTCKISNENADGTKNYYWFAPGIGLTKYIIGATNSNPDGLIQGELVHTEIQ